MDTKQTPRNNVNMNPEQINIAIAEWMGWTEIQEHWAWTRPIGKKEGIPIMVPDYCNDLNAIAGARNKLDPDNQSMFALNLIEIIGLDYDDPIDLGELFSIVNAPASKQCEALLRTIGKWRE